MQRVLGSAKRAGRRKGQMIFHVVAGHYPIRNGGEEATLRSLGVNREDGAVEGLLTVSGALTRGGRSATPTFRRLNPLTAFLHAVDANARKSVDVYTARGRARAAIPAGRPGAVQTV